MQTLALIGVAAAVGTLALAAGGCKGAVSRQAMRPAEAAAPAPPAFPQATLDNGLLRLTVYLPDAEKGIYRATRFAWSGVIARAEFDGHTVYGPFRAKSDPLTCDNNIMGPAEEFDLETSPPGYVEAKPGEAFLKIGVGALLKPDEPKYQFWNLYKFAKPPVWKVTAAEDRLILRQEAEQGGWGYVYTRQISLVPGERIFIITYILKNTGTKAIDTLFYCHNFTIIDDEPIGPNYDIAFPFPLVNVQQARGQMMFQDNEIVIPEVVEGSLWAVLAPDPGKVEDNKVRIFNRRTGTALHIDGAWAPMSWRFYAEKTAACPEPFLRIQLAPGEEKTWYTTYSFGAAKGKEAKNP